MNLVYDNYLKGKPAQWFCNADVPHSFGYTPELAGATALLGNTDSAYNEILESSGKQSCTHRKGNGRQFLQQPWGLKIKIESFTCLDGEGAWLVCACSGRNA